MSLIEYSSMTSCVTGSWMLPSPPTPTLSLEEMEVGVTDTPLNLSHTLPFTYLSLTHLLFFLVLISPSFSLSLSPSGGKSAIMTAIVVALGGKATTTHRASSLRNFIRTGAKYWSDLCYMYLYMKELSPQVCRGDNHHA